jgi:hypothetical protein
LVRQRLLARQSSFDRTYRRNGRSASGRSSDSRPQEGISAHQPTASGPPGEPSMLGAFHQLPKAVRLTWTR